jgi:hypothetical protein
MPSPVRGVPRCELYLAQSGFSEEPAAPGEAVRVPAGDRRERDSVARRVEHPGAAEVDPGMVDRCGFGAATAREASLWPRRPDSARAVEAPRELTPKTSGRRRSFRPIRTGSRSGSRRFEAPSAARTCRRAARTRPRPLRPTWSASRGTAGSAPSNTGFGTSRVVVGKELEMVVGHFVVLAQPEYSHAQASSAMTRCTYDPSAARRGSFRLARCAGSFGRSRPIRARVPRFFGRRSWRLPTRSRRALGGGPGSRS